MALLEGLTKGVNLGGWLSQCGNKYNEEHYNTFITEQDIKKIKDWGLDHLRLPVDYNVVQNEDGSFIESGFKHIDDCLSWCKKYGLKIVLDLHKTCGYVFDNAEYCGFFSDEKLQRMFKDLWLEFTRRYKDEDTMLFELLNEVTEARFATVWNRISKETIEEIRQLAPTKPIIIGGIYNSSIYGLTLMDAPLDEYVAFTFHCYDPMIFTHQGAGWVKNMLPDYSIRYPEEVEYMRSESYRVLGPDFDSHFEGLKPGPMNADFFRKHFIPALETQKKYNVELYCGEYGVIDAADNDSCKAWYEDIHTVLNEYAIPHTAWSYKQMDFDIQGTDRSPVLDTIIEA